MTRQPTRAGRARGSGRGRGAARGQGITRGQGGIRGQPSTRGRGGPRNRGPAIVRGTINARGRTTRIYRNPDSELFNEIDPTIEWDDRPTYTRPGHERETFNIGDVIDRPTHEPNMSETETLMIRRGHGYPLEVNELLRETGCFSHLALRGRRLRSHVFTKRRMYVIMYKFGTTMFGLPLFTHQEQGLVGMPARLRYQAVCLRDSMRTNEFINRGSKQPIDFVHCNTTDKRYGLSINTVIDMAKGITLTWSEEGIEIVGRLTESGFNRLKGYYNQLVATAQTEADTASWPAPDDDLQTL